MFLDFDGLRGRPLPSNWGCVFRVVLAAAVSPFDHVLAGMVEAGLGVEALCLHLGFARTVLVARLADLGLPAPHGRPLRGLGGKKPWLPEDVRQLISWWIEGVHVRSIADAIGVDRGAAKRSRGAVYAKARRLGLPARNREYLVYRTISELSGDTWAPGVSRGVVAGRHSGGKETSPPFSTPAPAQTRNIAEPVSARTPALASPPRPAAQPVLPVSVPLSGFGAVSVELSPAPLAAFESSVETAQHTEMGDLDGHGDLDRPIAVPFVPDGDDASPEPAAHELLESAFARFEGETGSEPIRPRPPELLAAMDRLEDLWKRTRGAGNDPDWTRMKLSREFVIELAVRGLANQSNAAIADAMGITSKKSGDWVSRLHIRRVLPDVTCEFDVQRAFAKLEKEGLVPRTCKKLKRLFFASKRENAQYCREGWRQLNKIKESGVVLMEEEPRKQRATPSLPVLKFLSRPMPEGCEESAPRRYAASPGRLFG